MSNDSQPPAIKQMAHEIHTDIKMTLKVENCDMMYNYKREAKAK